MNFTQHRKTSYRYQDAPEGEVIRIEVYYSKGGMNFATYKQEPRGIYVSVNSLKVERGEHFITEAFTMFASGWKIFAKSLKVASPKQLEDVARSFSDAAPQIAIAFKSDRNVAAQMIKNIIDEKGWLANAA